NTKNTNLPTTDNAVDTSTTIIYLMFDSLFTNDRIKGSKVHPTKIIEIKTYFRSSKINVPAPIIAVTITSKIDKRNNRLVIGPSYYYFYTKQSFLFTTSYPGNYII